MYEHMSLLVEATNHASNLTVPLPQQPLARFSHSSFVFPKLQNVLDRMNVVEASFAHNMGTDHPRIILCLVFAVALFVGRFVHHEMLNRSVDSDPLVLPFTIPFLGHTIDFFTDADGTVEKGRKYFQDRRDVFSLKIAGETVYVATAAEDAIAVSQNTSDFTFDSYIKDMMFQFGAEAGAVDSMCNPAKAQSCNSKKPMVQTARTMIRRQLHPGYELDRLQERLLRSIEDRMVYSSMTPESMIAGDSQQRLVSTLSWVRESLLSGATTAFFGDALLETEPDLLSSFFEFDDLSWKLTFKIPWPWSKDMEVLRKRTQNGIRRYLDLPSERREDACWLVKTLETEMRSLGIGSHDIAAYLTMFYWVLNSNAWKLCFWSLSYLIDRPDITQQIRQEVSPLVHLLESGEHNTFARALDGCNTLLSVYHEVLRLVASSTSVRDIEKDVIVGTKLLRKGHRIIIPWRQVLANEGAFGADLGDFRPERFQDGTMAAKLDFRPYGSGSTLCPGRWLARAEALFFVALAIVRFDIQPLKESHEHWKPFPRLNTKKPCIGILGPMRDDDMRIRLSPASWSEHSTRGSSRA